MQVYRYCFNVNFAIAILLSVYISPVPVVNCGHYYYESSNTGQIHKENSETSVQSRSIFSLANFLIPFAKFCKKCIFQTHASSSSLVSLNLIQVPLICLPFFWIRQGKSMKIPSTTEQPTTTVHTTTTTKSPQCHCEENFDVTDFSMTSPNVEESTKLCIASDCSLRVSTCTCELQDLVLIGMMSVPLPTYRDEKVCACKVSCLHPPQVSYNNLYYADDTCAISISLKSFENLLALCTKDIKCKCDVGIFTYCTCLPNQ